jgi:predicted aspartyl protease
MRRCLALIGLLALAACESDQFALTESVSAGGQCPLVRLAEMPIETRANLLFVQAEIDGQPLTLLIDTGAERTLLTEAAVNRLHLPRDSQHATRTFGIGSPTATWDATLPHGLDLGGTMFPVRAVTVGRFAMDRVGGSGADGLLGADILLAFDMDLDVPAGRLALYRARRACADLAPPWQVPYVRIAGVTAKRDRLLMPFLLDGVQGMGVLDTGAQLTSFSVRMVERTGLEEEQLANDRLITAHGAAPDNVSVHIHQFRELRIGPAIEHDPRLPVVPMSSGIGDALIGGDFLKGRRAWISFATQQVYVTLLPPHSAIAQY